MRLRVLRGCCAGFALACALGALGCASGRSQGRPLARATPPRQPWVQQGQMLTHAQPPLPPVVTELELTPASAETPAADEELDEAIAVAADRAEQHRASGFEPASLTARESPGREPPGAPAAPMDHAPDYSWIQGELEHSALRGGMWKIRYAPLSADDKHGGSVVLESDPSAHGLQAGDIVYAEGQILERDRPGALRSPIYRAERIVRADGLRRR